MRRVFFSLLSVLCILIGLWGCSSPKKDDSITPEEAAVAKLDEVVEGNQSKPSQRDQMITGGNMNEVSFQDQQKISADQAFQPLPEDTWQARTSKWAHEKWEWTWANWGKPIGDLFKGTGDLLGALLKAAAGFVSLWWLWLLLIIGIVVAVLIFAPEAIGAFFAALLLGGRHHH